MRSSLLNTLLPCCFSNPYTSADAYLQPLTTVRPGGVGGGLGGVGGGGLSSSGGGGGGNRPPPSLEELRDASAAAREATWRSLGALEPLALSQHPAGPAAGGPKVRGGIVQRGGLKRGNSAFDSSLLFLSTLAPKGASSGPFVPMGVDCTLSSAPETRKRCTSGEGKGREGAKKKCETESFFFVFFLLVPSIAHRFCFSQLLLLLLPPPFLPHSRSPRSPARASRSHSPPSPNKTHENTTKKNSGRRAGAPSGWSGAPTATSCSRPTASRTRLTT